MGVIIFLSMSIELRKLGKLLRNERRKNNLKLEAVVVDSGVSYNALWNIENGGDFKMSTFIKLCAFYHLDIKNIFVKKKNISLNLTDKQLEKLNEFLDSLM